MSLIDSNCSLVIDLHNHIFNENNCYYFQTIFNESNMSNRRKSILSNKGNICDCTNLTLDNGRNTKNRDVYRSILGPTPDESILAGLQTVIDMCGILENTTQAIQRMDETYSEVLTYHILFKGFNKSTSRVAEFLMTRS